PTGNPDYFTTAFFHRPGGLREEMVESGFTEVEIYAVEGISWAAPDLAERLADPAKRAIVLDMVARTETEPALLGASPHLLAVGRA
ncbi:MAG: SAM-dependent methyltransferase, partial [Acidimicrobiia bacterium]|nr:SAM-dependent methyltransferase [Acidimicrobiia bacterium]